MTANTIAVIAKRLGVSERTVRRLIDRREFGCVRVGKNAIRITEEQFAEYLERQTRPALDVTTEAGKVVLRAVGGAGDSMNGK